MCLQRSHSSQSRWPEEKKSSRSAAAATKRSDFHLKKEQNNVLRSLPTTDPQKTKQLNNKSRSASNCSSTEGCLDPGVVRNAAKTSPSPRRAPCAPHCRRSDGRRDVNAEKGKDGKRRKEEEYETSASCQNSDGGTIMWTHWSAPAMSTKWTDVLPEKTVSCCCFKKN